MQITYSQCKQLTVNHNLREIIASLSDQPAWITQELDIADIQAIQQGGCASGAYMPAVTYYDALETMRRHGDEVIEYLSDNYGDMPVPEGLSWSHLNVYFLSSAVECWASQFDLEGVNWD